LNAALTARSVIFTRRKIAAWCIGASLKKQNMLAALNLTQMMIIRSRPFWRDLINELEQQNPKLARIVTLAMPGTARQKSSR
jgi:hypothetical protein